jgi:hypothetical protein
MKESRQRLLSIVYRTSLTAQANRTWYIILVYAKKTPSRWYVPVIIIIIIITTNADAAL